MDKRQAMTKAERDRRWRAKNPDKVAAQNARARERHKAKRAAFLAANPPPTPEEREAHKKARALEYNRRYREARRNDPALREKQKERWARYYRKKRGIPADARLQKQKYTTEEERRAAMMASKRRAYAKKRGLTVEELDARKAEREAAMAANKQRHPEDPAIRARRAAEKRAAKERAKKLAAPVVRTEKTSPAPVNSNDPPELIELFRKAAKGEPLRPYNPKGRKVSVFAFRGSIIQPKRI